MYTHNSQHLYNEGKEGAFLLPSWLVCALKMKEIIKNGLFYWFNIMYLRFASLGMSQIELSV